MLRTAFLSFLDLIVPPRPSERALKSLALEDLFNMSTNSPAGEGLPYRDEAVRALVWEIKYYGNARAAALAGGYMADALLALCAEEIGTPLLIPVPMHPARRKARGHNQTELICEAALRRLCGAVEYRKDIVSRVVDTPTQQGLERAKRLRNVHKSMMASAAARGRACIVVDDVSTTGATLAEAKRALMAAGARRVHCVALAKS